MLAVANPDSVPPDAPKIVEERILLPSGSAKAGRVMVVCGVDGNGRPYRTEMLFFFEGDVITVIEPIYWSGLGIGTGDGRAQTSSGPDPNQAC